MIDRRRSGERPGGASFKTPLGVRAGLTLGLQWLCEVKLVDGFTIHLLGRTIFRDPFWLEPEVHTLPKIDKNRWKSLRSQDYLQEVHIFRWHRWRADMLRCLRTIWTH